MFVNFQIDDYSMVSFVPLNLCDQDSIMNVLIQIDNAIQYGEDLDVREMKVNKNLYFHVEFMYHHLSKPSNFNLSHHEWLLFLL